jgi:Heavy metal binding domain
LLLTTASFYPATVVTAQQKNRSAHSKKPAEFHYVCPMHETVTSKKRGTCPKCKMKLVRKPIVKEPSTGSN